MKAKYILLAGLCVSGSLSAQVTPDSTDVFFQHLELNEVIVTGVTGNTKLKNSPAPISVMTAKELRSTAATNLIDAISHEPGVSQLTTGSGISKPVIRGMGYNRIAVIHDGIRQEGQQWGDEHGIEIDAQDVGSVEILKGPASLMYGSDALAGVLIFHSAPILPSGMMSVNLSSEYQTNNGLFDYSLNFAGNKQHFVWNVRYSDKRAHAYKNRYDGYVPNSQFKERSLSAMLGIQKSWGQSLLRLGYYKLTPGIVEGERDPQTGELESPVDNVKTYGKALPFQQVYHYKAVLDNSFNLPDGNLKAIIGYQQNRRQEFEESPDEYGLYFQLHTVNYDIRYLTNEFNGWKINIGMNGMWQRSQNKGEEYLIPAYRLFDFGVFATVSKELKRWTLSGGARFDYRHLHSEQLEDDGVLRFKDFKRNFNGVTGSIGAVFHAADNLDFKLNIARGFRMPNMSELGSNGVHEGTIRYEIGNADLKPEYSLQADLGMNFNSKYVELQVGAFANRIDNYIFAHRIDEQMEEGYMTYRFDQGDARLLGFEASLDIHPVHWIHFGNSYSMVDAIQLHQPKETKYLPYIPAARWNSDLKFELTHHGKVLNNTYVAVGLEHYFRQDHYYMADDTETATPGYTLFNLSAGTDIHIKGKKVAELYLTAENLTNKAYQSHLSRLKYADVNSVTGRRGVFNMGRNVTFKIVIPLNIEH